jgi:hypothetical protein
VKFLWVTGNHSASGRDTLFDIIDAIGGQMVDLGHQVEHHENTMGRDYTNILIEAFDSRLEDQYRRSADAGARFVIIMTERPGKPGFNDSYNPQMIERQRAFPLIARHAIAVWCLVPGAAAWVKQFQPNAADLELGWSDYRARALNSGSVEPLTDFAYYGSMTPRRRGMIAAFKKRGYIVENDSRRDSFMTPMQRNAMVAFAKVVLGIDPYPDWKLVSNSRLATALALGRPVIAEPPKGTSAWSDVGVFAKSKNSYIDEAIAMLPRWREIYAEQRDKAREFLSPEKCVGRVMRETGIVE